MGEWYFGSLLVVVGACVAFALQAAALALETRARRYVYLLLLAILEGGYCLVAYRYLHEPADAKALPWGQSICVFTPFITYVFGELTIELVDPPFSWLRRAQKVNLALTTVFALAVASDMALKTRIVLEPWLVTDLDSDHLHRLVFTPIGMGYLAWVAVAFTAFAALLFRDPRARGELLPMTVGCVVYFASTILDFGILVGLRDGHFIQHLGFFILLVGCWRVLAARFEQSLAEQKEAVARLEAQRQKLLIAAPRLHKQKLESLGTLAAGVAHEINNPIAGILNYAQLMKRSLPEDAEARPFSFEIEREARRVAGIVKNLLHFGRAEDSFAVAAQARDVVSDTLTLVQSLLENDDIAIRVEVAPDIPEIVCSVQQLEQVLMNLVMNARDALNRRDPARHDQKHILVQVGRRSPREGDSEGEGPSGVVFEITDNGDGFDAATAERIFDPFFTTKPHGEDGVGLGLSISHGIVRAHGGTLSCESVPGEHTTFRVELPCTPPGSTPDVARETPSEGSTPSERSAPSAGSESYET